jgi:K+-sensing histidine kinase KdpD
MRTWNRTETSVDQPRKGFDWILEPDRHPCAGTLEIVVPYIGSELTGKVMERAAVLAAGLNVALKLVAVYVAPYPADLDCPTAMEEHLTARLAELAERSTLHSSVELVVARDRGEGLRQVLPPVSTVLLGSRRRWWRTAEERLARALTRQGHHVSLIRFE